MSDSHLRPSVSRGVPAVPALCVFAALGLSLPILSCRNPGEPLWVERYPDIRQFVTGDAAAALGPDGRFQLSPELPPNHDGVPVISAARAKELVRAFKVSFGRAYRSIWSQDRGGPVRVEELELSTRMYAAATPFERLPDVGCHPFYARLTGSHYLMTLDDRGDPRVHIAVAAQATNYSVDPSGELVLPEVTGSGFDHYGIPIDQSWVPLSPEQAVALAAVATGARVVTVPFLALPAVHEGDWHSPTTAFWHVVLDRDVQVRLTSGALRETRDLYVWGARDHRFYVAGAVQPDAHTFPCLLGDGTAEEPEFALVNLPVRPGRIIAFERVEAIRP